MEFLIVGIAIVWLVIYVAIRLWIMNRNKARARVLHYYPEDYQ